MNLRRPELWRNKRARRVPVPADRTAGCDWAVQPLPA